MRSFKIVNLTLELIKHKFMKTCDSVSQKALIVHKLVHGKGQTLLCFEAKY
jgi:hypothetical protein